MFAASLRSMPTRLSGNVCRTGCRGAPCTHSRTLINTQAWALMWESEEPFTFTLRCVPLWRVLPLELFVSNTAIRWCFTEVTLHEHVCECAASSSILCSHGHHQDLWGEPFRPVFTNTTGSKTGSLPN